MFPKTVSWLTAVAVCTLSLLAQELYSEQKVVAQESGSEGSESAPLPAATEKQTTSAQQSPQAQSKADQQASPDDGDQATPTTGERIPLEKVPVVAWKLLTDAVTSDKVRLRSDAVTGLAVMEDDRRSIRLIEDRLEDKDDTIRLLAVNALGGIPARSAIPELRTALDDSAPQVRFAAAQALWKMGDHSGRDILFAVLNGEMPTGPGFIQSHINDTKKEMHDPKALALMGINQVTGQFLGPFSMGVSIVEEYAKNKSTPVQTLCLQLLSADHSADTVNQVKMALGDQSWAVRAAAARALAKLEWREAIPRLATMMQYDKSQAARLIAAGAILHLERTAPAKSTGASAKSNATSGSPAQLTGRSRG